MHVSLICTSRVCVSSTLIIFHPFLYVIFDSLLHFDCERFTFLPALDAIVRYSNLVWT